MWFDSCTCEFCSVSPGVCVCQLLRLCGETGENYTVSCLCVGCCVLVCMCVCTSVVVKCVVV